MLSLYLVFASLLIAALAQTAPAPKVVDNHEGDAYDASLQSGSGQIRGVVSIRSDSQGEGVHVTLTWNGFDLADSTEYTYHIHEKPVPADGNCNGTGKHFDSYAVGDENTCDPAMAEYCQLGDLSGKHGAIQFNGTEANNTFGTAYHDDFLSTTPGDTAFFGNLSVVVHRNRDSYRLNCGNFAKLDATTSTNPSNATVTSGTAMYSNSTNPTSTEFVATSTVVNWNNTSELQTSTAIATIPASTSTVHPTATATSTAQSTATGAQTGHASSIRAAKLQLLAVAFAIVVFG